ncbi:hypothetical protein Tfer_0451 [Thermincola ferriacetica]|uniref:Uncharacterized protein n=2 Tax=Thermincola TaxID=278993 RepID=D5X7E6_THEPJ|nr:conserved hypothetical protein [Thermincola potens JR]KNZ70772.1 hypothetical protein Tfer_0451 [Thermincola ferriacetica]
MFFILRNKTKEKITFGIRILITIVILGMVITHLYGIYNGYVFTSQRLLREDKPSGNPMRVEQTQTAGDKEMKTDNLLDEFVVKLKDFYKKD